MGYARGELLAGGKEADKDAGHAQEVESEEDVAGDFHISILDLYLFVISSSWF